MTTYTADDFKRAEFARHPEEGGVGMRKDAGDPNTWCVAYEDPGWRIGIRSDIEMARDGWVPVPAGSDTRTDEDGLTLRLVQQQRDQATARAEKAEQERDEARAERDSWRAQVPLAEWERELIRATENPRPLTEPTRPEGAEELAAAISEWDETGVVVRSLDEADADELADHLAALGYRKTP